MSEVFRLGETSREMARVRVARRWVRSSSERVSSACRVVVAVVLGADVSVGDVVVPVVVAMVVEDIVVGISVKVVVHVLLSGLVYCGNINSVLMSMGRTQPGDVL